MERPNIKFELIEAGPDTFRAWFARNKNFRRIDASRVARFEEIFGEDGSGYVIDGNTFRFGVNGEFIDGQHRAQALLNLGLTVWVLVVSGITSDATIDGGVSRSLTQKLASMQEHSPKDLASALRKLWEYHCGKGFNHAKAMVPGKDELLFLLSQNPSIRDSVAFALTMERIAPVSNIALMHYVVGREDVGMIERFFQLAATGVGLGHNDPILKLRKILETDKKDRNAKMPQMVRLAYLIKAWNYWLEGKQVTNLMVRLVGPAAEPFPEIKMPSSIAKPRIAV